MYEILIAGFDESRAQPGLYAAGVYFASQACKSAQYATKYWSERGSCPDECSSGQSKGKGKGEGEDAKILTHPRGGERGGQLCSDGRIKAGRTTFLLYSRVLLGWKPHLVQHCGNLALDPWSGIHGHFDTEVKAAAICRGSRTGYPPTTWRVLCEGQQVVLHVTR